jgi:pimeloyl-ACP methyl ester carboxylesterase
MKFGAQSPFRSGGDGMAVVEEFLKVIDSSRKPLKLHLVGHSTGAILHAYLAAALSKLERKVRVASASMLAPAATVELFKSHYRPLLKAPKSQTGINRMDIYNLSDKLERDDTVIGIYRKSLLYLVSRSFEEDERPAAILGMEKYKRGVTAGLKNLTIHYSHGNVQSSKKSKSESHGGFDNDPTTMNNVLQRVLGRRPAHPFTAKSLKY